jgi:hypothetical protein
LIYPHLNTEIILHLVADWQWSKQAGAEPITLIKLFR